MSRGRDAGVPKARGHGRVGCRGLREEPAVDLPREAGGEARVEGLGALRRCAEGRAGRQAHAGADDLLDLERSLESRALAGGTARVRVEANLEEIAGELAAERAEIERLEAEAAR